MKVPTVNGNDLPNSAVSGGMVDLVWRAALLVVLGAALGAGGNALRPNGLAVTTFAPPATCSVSEGGGVGPDVQLVSQDEATALCADSGTLIADVRPAQAFAEGHVAGAIHLPCSASEQAASAAEHGLANKQQLLVYGESAADAFPVAEQMQRRLGRADLTIRVLEGGFQAWSEAGLACTSGECPACGAPEHAHSEPAP